MVKLQQALETITFFVAVSYQLSHQHAGNLQSNRIRTLCSGCRKLWKTTCEEKCLKIHNSVSHGQTQLHFSTGTVWSCQHAICNNSKAITPQIITVLSCVSTYLNIQPFKKRQKEIMIIKKASTSEVCSSTCVWLSTWTELPTAAGQRRTRPWLSALTRD